ncbi:MAG: DUF2892 domain-containing protein [Gammaproteobacteria bacterium]|nr:DUF2892 domain-containing protein [Gammaproteobacteria bacterium]
MTERTYRFVLGAALTLLLYFHIESLQYLYLSVLLWEALTGFRVPLMVSRWRYGANFHDEVRDPATYRFTFEAERGMRVAFVAVLIMAFFVIPADYWYISWMAAIMLFLAGLVNFCPMVAMLRWVGFR